MAPEDPAELAYYREVEDLFAALRGVPHVLSPKDFQLMRSWWRDEVPMSAIRTGVTEVFARRLERGDREPVVSLSYCRHAVAEHARRLAEMRVGETASSRHDTLSVAESIERLTGRLAAAADATRPSRPRVAEVIDRIRLEVDAATMVDSAFVEEHLFALESTLLADCLEALDDDDRRRLETRARADAEAMTLTPEARDRTFRALRDRLLRTLLDLPRLELAE
jgi:hypothetical protein